MYFPTEKINIPQIEVKNKKIVYCYNELLYKKESFYCQFAYLSLMIREYRKYFIPEA